MPSHARAVRGAASVAGVAAFVAALIVTGRPGGLTGVTAQAAVQGSAVTAAITTPEPPLDSPALSPQAVKAALAPLKLSPAMLRASRVTRSHAREAHRWVRPNTGVLTSCFCMRWGTLHPGIDLAASYGSPILAATDGCIEAASYDGGYGNRILIKDWDGTETLYGHMSAFVKTSGCVHAGEQIGREGSTGFSTGPHLHFEVHVGGVTIDPIPFLAKRGVKI